MVKELICKEYEILHGEIDLYGNSDSDHYYNSCTKEEFIAVFIPVFYYHSNYEQN